MNDTFRDKPITRDDIVGSFQGLKSDLDERTEKVQSNKQTIIAIGATVAVVLVFLIGRRVGRKKSTVVQIRRI